MFAVGITGGIGSGKSTAADRFIELGVPAIDADVVARELVKPGRSALKRVIDTFGVEVTTADGRLDRVKLRKIVFSDSEKKSQLENILHPEIHAEILRQLSESTAPYKVVVIPLLAESKRQYPLDRILVIDAPHELQIERVSARDNQSPQEAEHIIQLQASRQARMAIADDVIVNNGSTQDLQHQVDALHKKYLAYACGSDEPENA